MKIKANGKSYEIGELTLGEFRLLKKRYGVERMDLLDPRDPEHLIGFLVVAELRESPGRELDDIDAEFASITTVEVENEDAEDDEDPTQAGSPASPSEPSPSDSDAERPAVSS